MTSNVLPEQIPPSSTAESENPPSGGTLKTVNLTDGMIGEEACDVDVFIRNLWSYIIDTNPDTAPVYDSKLLAVVLDKAERILQQEPTVLDLQGPLIIIGDIQGHGDSLLTLLSLASHTPKKRFLFLGNYSGSGFASIECLFLVLALKVRHPKRVFLLRGNMEDAGNAKARFFIEELAVRNAMTDVYCWLKCERIFNCLPLAAIVGCRIFCVHGGVGEHTLASGISGIRAIQRPPLMPQELAITQELTWGCLSAKDTARSRSADNCPTFTEADVDKFCASNNMDMIIRSRQLVSEGVLNMPTRMITVWSAVSLLDNFNNSAAALLLDHQCKEATVISYSLFEQEPKSLDDFKPIGGRSTLAI